MKNKKLVPVLRFAGFEGEWVEKRFGELYSFKTTNSFSRENLNYETGIVKNIHYGDIHTKLKSHFDIEREAVPYINLDVDIAKISKDSYLENGDLVIADASEDYNDIGKTIEIINLNGEKVVAGLHTFLARKESHEIAIGFVSFLMQTWTVRLGIMKIAQGTKVLGISSKRLAEISIHLPSLPEQQKIAAFLSAIDRRMQLLQAKKARLEEYKKGLMQGLFSGRLRFREFQNDGYTAGFLDDFCEINPNSKELPDVFVYIDLESVSRGVLENPSTLSKKLAPSRAQRLLKKGDILYQTVRPYQRNNFHFYLDGDYVASTGYAQIRVRGKGHPGYFFQLLHTDSFVNEVLKRCTGTGYPSINSSDLAKISVKIPSLPEQQKIATFLTAIDRSIAAVALQVEQCAAYKKALLQRMFV